MNIKHLVLHTSESYAPLALRLLLGIVIFGHGAQKLLGWFGGYGFEGTMQYFTQDVGLPWAIGLLVIIIEFFGPLFIIVGLGTRLWSLALLVVMAGIIITTFHQFFFMNWFGSQKEEGYEFFLLVISISVSLTISGSGNWSVDRYLSKDRSTLRSSSFAGANAA